MTFTSGRYIGNGVDDRKIIGVGFQPSFVIVKANSSAAAALKTSDMAGDTTKLFASLTLAANHIQSLDSDGFTIGTAANVNTSGVVYCWFAGKEEAGFIKVGTYNGNGSDNRNITGVGFQPDMVMVAGNTTNIPFGGWVTSLMTADLTNPLRGNAGGQFPDGIQALQSDGFQIGQDGSVNLGTGTPAYYYIAVKNKTGEFKVGQYTGDGNDNVNITGLGFRPGLVWIAAKTTHFVRYKCTATGPITDSAQSTTTVADTANLIQALQENGFQIGNASSGVNVSTQLYDYFAFKDTRSSIGFVGIL